MAVDKAFLGTGWKFPPEFDPRSRQVRMVSAEDDIRESLRILFSTSPGERVMQPAYGCALRDLVFEGVTEGTRTEIQDVIERAVLFFEPRIELNDIEIDISSVYDGLITIELTYTIRSINTRSNLVYPFYFREGTNVRF